MKVIKRPTGPLTTEKLDALNVVYRVCYTGEDRRNLQFVVTADDHYLYAWGQHRDGKWINHFRTEKPEDLAGMSKDQLRMWGIVFFNLSLEGP